MKRNSRAALLAVLGGLLLLVAGWSGVSGIDHVFALLDSWLGPTSALRDLAWVLGGIASLGGVAVLLGAYLLFRDHVRTGRILILLGSGMGTLTLLIFLARNLAEEDFSYLTAVLPAILGVVLGILAQKTARPKSLIP